MVTYFSFSFSSFDSLPLHSSRCAFSKVRFSFVLVALSLVLWPNRVLMEIMPLLEQKEKRGREEESKPKGSWQGGKQE